MFWAKIEKEKEVKINNRIGEEDAEKGGERNFR